MAFRPTVNSEIIIRGRRLFFCEHPVAPGIPYGQAGKRATVYQVGAGRDEFFALKVFHAAFRTPETKKSAMTLSAYAEVPGLQVCQREVLDRARDSSLLQAYPELSYAVLMPWVNGQTWYDVLCEQQPLSKGQSVGVARAFLSVLNEMEQRGIAHCDLSSPNVLIDGLQLLEASPQVSLVDVEDMFGPGFAQPSVLPGGSTGYAHRTSRKGQWNVQADRFAGGILASEMLAWCDKDIRDAAEGEQFFAQSELQTPSPRFDRLYLSLKNNWGLDVAALFQKSWQSETLQDCPTFAVWLAAVTDCELKAVVTFRHAAKSVSPLPDDAPEPTTQVSRRSHDPTSSDDMSLLLRHARRFEEAGDPQSALDLYQVVARKSKEASLQSKIVQLQNLVNVPATLPPVPPLSFPVPRQLDPVVPVAPAPRPVARRTPSQPRARKNFQPWLWISIGLALFGVFFVALAGGGLLLFGSVPTQPPAVDRASQVSGHPAAVQDPTRTPVPPADYVIVKNKFVNLRKGPHLSHPLANLFAYPKGTQLEVLGYSSNWLYVQAPDGELGWVEQTWVDASTLNVALIPEIRSVPTVPPPSPTP